MLEEENGHGWHYGYDLARKTGVNYATVNNALRQFAKAGYAEAERHNEYTPPRHYYRFTLDGRLYAAREAWRD